MANNCNQPLLQTSSCNTPPPDEISHKVKIDENREITVLKPKVDTIGLTIRANEAFEFLVSPKSDPATVAKQFWEDVYKRVSVLADDPEVPIEWAPKAIPLYKKNLRIKVGTEQLIKLSAEPRKTTDFPIRFEWSPAATSPGAMEEWSEAWHLIDTGFDLPFELLMREARITRLDITVDVLGLSLADLVVVEKDVWKIWICTSSTAGAETFQFYRGFGGKQPTHADPKKRANLIIYDKRKEQQDKGLTPRFGETEHIRVEASLNTNRLFKNLPDLKFPFEGWNFRHPVVPDIPGFEEWIWQFFFDSCRLRGFDEAKRLLPEKYKAHGLPAQEWFVPYELITPETFKQHWAAALDTGQLSPLIAWSKASLEELKPGLKGQWFAS